MENNLMIFENPEFGAVRSILIDGDPWFVGKDQILQCHRNDQCKYIFIKIFPFDA